MKKQIIESVNVMTTTKDFVFVETTTPFHTTLSLTATRAVALFWSVFGPAARYNFGTPEYAYAASLRP